MCLLLLYRKSPDGRPKTQQLLAEVEEVKGIMHTNIDVMLKNHEKVSTIQDKTGIAIVYK